MSVTEEIGIAFKNNCALVIKDDTFRIIKSDEKASAFNGFINMNYF